MKTEKRLINAGFTLLEIMVAVSILAIVFTSVFRMHSQTLTMSDSVRFYATAPLLTQKKLAEIDMASPEGVLNDSGDFGDHFPGYRWQVSVSEIESEILKETAENLKQIDLTVSWNDNSYVYRARTYRFVIAEE